MSSFHLFPKLPTELRLEIWRAYFAICHGTQVHIFLSAPEGPRYIRQDAATGAEGYDTLAGARVCADSWAVFQEAFYMGDLRCLRPSNHGSNGGLNGLNGGGGRTPSPSSISTTPSTPITIASSTTPTITASTTTSAREEGHRRQYTLRFAVSKSDMMYIIDTKVSPILLALSSAPWFRRAPRIAIQVFNFHTPAPNPELLPDPRPYPHNLDYWGRNWVLWNKLLSSLYCPSSLSLSASASASPLLNPSNSSNPPNPSSPQNALSAIRTLMTNPALEQLLFVVVPNREIQRTCYLRPNTYGFQVVDPESFALGSADEVHAVNGHAGLAYARVHRAFPGLGVDRKIGYVADAVPGRAGFSCLDGMWVNGY